MDQVDVRALRRSLLAAERISFSVDTATNWLDDLKLFAAAALGGLVFFSTFIG
jgi:hypothetical protein